VRFVDEIPKGQPENY